REDGKVELREKDVYSQLGFSWAPSKKWSILTIIFLVQLSMNLNAGIYGSALEQFQDHFSVAPQVARLGQGLFLISYAFGCELWAPFSEELGRKPVLQASLFLVNVWALGCALAPNFPALVIFRVLQGFSSAGGSVTLGMVADMFEPERQGNAVAYIVLSSVGGSVLGPIVGGFQARYLSWRWNFWLQLIFGGAVQLLHLLVPETKASILTTRIAKERRANGQEVYSTHELETKKWEIKEILQIMARPFIMFATEPIVLCLSLLSGFADALIFTFLESFGLIFRQWDFGTVALGLAFIPLLVGYCISYLSFIPFIRRDEKIQAEHPDKFRPEQKLYWLLYTAPLLAIGLFAFAWTSQGPAVNPWIVPLVFSALIGIANYAIYFATIDYMIHAYGPYSASATGGNGFARDFLAGIATFYSIPLYQNIGSSNQLAFGSTVLGGLAVAVTIPIYIFYAYGPQIRARSKFAQVLKGDRE
ncbi:putative MFS multidrug transporter, partial [Cystobasidium minutum MCA 4210]|uniref:putative MFS multidrug transporter n=1 Tax=Cystobasidium minutum MCA 4210 TaxID=1397322 RepID=UPI0034CFE4B6